jgi:hypothetical protein
MRALGVLAAALLIPAFFAVCAVAAVAALLIRGYAWLGGVDHGTRKQMADALGGIVA